MNRSPTPRSVSIFTADFRRLKFTHTGAQVFDGIPGPRKLQCEVFSPLSLGLVESHCTRLPASSTQPLEAMMHDDLSRRVWLAGLSDGKSPHIKRPHSLKTMRLTMRNVSRFRNAKIGGQRTDGTAAVTRPHRSCPSSVRVKTRGLPSVL